MGTSPITDNQTDTPSEKEVQLANRVDDLESKLAFQDDVIDQLNDELTVHQANIAQLNADLQLIAKRLKDMAPSNIGKQEDEPPPPHY